jgi:membrane protease YdiL (CAAX protease family)
MAPARSQSDNNPIEVVLVYIVFAAMIAWFVWWGLHLRGTKLGNLIQDPASRMNPWKSVGIGGLACVGLLVSTRLIFFVFPPRHPNPSSSLYSPVLIAAAMIGAILEEVLFRGYFQKQVSAILRSSFRGILFQAALFVLIHGLHQSVAGVLDKFVFGLVLGLLAQQSRSLVPGMIAHALGNAVTFLIP